MSGHDGFDLAGLVGQLGAAVVLIVLFIALAPALLDAVLRVAPSVLILMVVFLTIRGMLKKFLG